MTASVPLSQRSVSDQRRAVVWLGVLTLLLSLLTPIVSIQAADATQTRTSQEACDPGFVPNDESGECEPSSPANLQIAQECDEGTVLNQDTGECEPEAPDEPQRVPAECPEGEELNRETGACIPIPSDEPSLVQDCPDGTALNQQTGQCEANVPPAESTDAPMLDEPPPDTGGTITIQKWNCPAGYDVAEAADPLADCTEAAGGVTFTIDDGNLPGPDQVEVTGDDQGAVVFGGLEPGTHTVTEEVPAGIAYATGWCHALNGAPIHLDNPPRLVFEIGDVAHWTCDWLNVPEEDETGSTVTVVKWRCPLGVPEDEDLLAYSGICTQQHNGVDFTLDHAGGSFPGTTENGEIEWTGVPAGDVEVQETVPPGFEDPKVFCLSKPVGGNGPWQQVPADGGLIPLDIPEDGWEIHCEVFNIPGQEASITVHKFNCPGGDFGESLVAHEAGCTDVGNGIEFTLDNSDGSSTQAIAGGSAIWNDVPEGPFTITETIPPGWSEPNWFCGENYIDEETGFVVIGFMGPVDAPDGVRTGSIGHATTEYFCKVYNFPDADTNSLTVHKWLCPAGFDENIDDPETHCTEAMDGVTFTLGDMEATTGDAGPGTAVFVDIPAGDHGLIEVLPGGIARGFNGGCSVNGQPVPLLAVIVTEPPTIWVTFVGEGAHWVCDWYNVPEDEEENSVTIRKWICPTGTGHDESQAWYEANCVQQHDGVEFKISSDLGIAVTETAGGAVQFDGLPAGVVGIQETIPAGFGEPIVFCTDNGAWDLYPAPTGHWQHEFSHDGTSEAFVCYVYNIPGERPDVTIHKWTCPEGYDLNAAGANPKVDCTEATNGVEFQFGPSAPAAEAKLQTTGDVIDGGVIFDDLEPGTYKATELVPEGIDHVFVLECTGHIMGVLQPYPLQMGNVLDNIDVDAGEHLVCHWYNVPGTDGEKLSLVKYICSTETFVSDVDCEIYEGGATFDLLRWNAGDGVWEVIDTEVTDGTGMVVWPDVDLGDYRLDELDGEWCHLTTTPVFGPGDGFSVFEGDETVVHVYNCDPDWTTTTIPQKYPNTGVAPAETDSGRRDVAQGALMQIDPTAEPGTQLQANPTEEPDLPIRVSPTQTPTPRVTQEPDSPGGLQANPTEVPSEEPPDSDNDLPLQIEPTQAPAAELPGDAGQIEIGATIYVQADVCDGVGFDPYASTYWWGFIAGCPHPPNGWPVLDFEFIATDGAGFLESSSPGWPADVVVFDVPATTVTISTSVPDGFAEPVSLCIDAAGGYTPVLNEPPPGVLLHTTGDSVTLDLDPGQSYACTFYHVTEVPHSNAVTVNTWLCPQGMAQGMVLTEYMDVCADEHNDVDLTLYPYVGGPQAATTVDGVAHWDSVSMGQIILVLDSPSGFGEPVVFCGTTESPGGGIQHPALVPPDNQGNYRGMLEVPGAELVCHWFSIPTGPGGFSG